MAQKARAATTRRMMMLARFIPDRLDEHAGDQIGHHCAYPCDDALEEYDIERPFAAKFTTDGRDGCDTRCI